ncbi:MAG: putative lipid II flippase FtsW [Lactobacillus sp.]|jgi:cell division protein FtsW|nr:putative lipid II flippase FtsW [Lactobacillus sp.]
MAWISFSRNSRSRLSNWWWTVDKVLLVLVIALILIGIFLIFAASPAVAERISAHSGKYSFVKKQLFFLPIAFALMIFLSMQNLKSIRRIAILGYLATIALMIATLFWGDETKGAARWIRIFGFSLQPSEFIKPTFAVVAAWLFDGQKKYRDFPGNLLSTGLFIVTVALLLLQPDVGMSLVVSAIWLFQFFLAGLSIVLVTIMGIVGIGLLVLAYFTFDHVQIRVQQFLDSENNLSFQVRKSLEAFKSGNIFGRGPGEGVVKLNIPDAHTDFIFPVAAEEFGIILCLVIVAIYATIVIRSMIISLKDNNLFIILSASALAASFGLQGIINMASTLHLMPTKGMTLPFISYGGSSLLATSLGIGMLLAITRKNVHAEDKDEY